MTEQQYLNYEVSSNNLPSLKDVIDYILIEKTDEDSMLRNAQRLHLIMLAKEAVNQLKFKNTDLVKAIIFDVPSNLIMPFEDDYSEFVRASVKCGCEYYPLKTNNKPKSITTYLQDCKGELIFDCNGEVVNADSDLKCSHDNCYKECNTCVKVCFSTDPCDECANKFKNSSIWVRDGFYQFSNDLEDAEVFLEYLADDTKDANGNYVSECAIKVKPIYFEAIKFYVYWKYYINRSSTTRLAPYYKSEWERELRKIDKKKTKKTTIDEINNIMSLIRSL